MYGLPARPLTYEEEVVLDLCMDRACRRLAKVQVEAARIAAGGLPPADWFLMDADDEKAGRQAYETAMLRSELAKAAKRGRRG